MDYHKFEENMVILLKIFNERPNHLTKFLLDNKSFNQRFIKKVINSEKINNISDPDKIDFKGFNEMKYFFDHIIDGSDVVDDEVSKDMNSELFMMINSERFEEAAKLRDYMIRRNIKIII